MHTTSFYTHDPLGAFKREDENIFSGNVQNKGGWNAYYWYIITNRVVPSSSENIPIENIVHAIFRIL